MVVTETSSTAGSVKATGDGSIGARIRTVEHAGGAFKPRSIRNIYGMRPVGV